MFPETNTDIGYKIWKCQANTNTERDKTKPDGNSILASVTPVLCLDQKGAVSLLRNEVSVPPGSSEAPSKSGEDDADTTALPLPSDSPDLLWWWFNCFTQGRLAAPGGSSSCWTLMLADYRLHEWTSLGGKNLAVQLQWQRLALMWPIALSIVLVWLNMLFTIFIAHEGKRNDSPTSFCSSRLAEGNTQYTSDPISP